MLQVIMTIVFICFFGAAIYVSISMAMKQARERKLYTKMMGNPCDKTVMDYIPAFNATYGLGSGWVNSEASVAHRNNVLRQSDGWEVIRDCDAVSQEAKDKLRNAFIAHGVRAKK